jgi:hypothetical protein
MARDNAFRISTSQTRITMRLLFIVVMLFTCACSVHKSELDETLEWMDNTYNRHESVSGANGHGRSAWYGHSEVGSAREVMVSGWTGGFTYKGCEMTLRTETLPESETAQGLITSRKSKFELKDIDPSSIKVTAISHLGGFPCNTAPGEEPSIMAVNCDHAQMSFSTRSAAGLIQEEWHTVYPKLAGADHESLHSSKSNSEYFGFDDPEYAQRFAKAFAHAVELCGGRRSPF